MNEPYKYYLEYKGVRTKVIEPIGWDGFETVIYRDEKTHGLISESSDISLKFDENIAIDIIKQAYEDSLDALVTFIAEYEGVVEYTGQVDFTVYGEGHDKYHYIETTLKDLDIRTMVKSRSEQKVDLDSRIAFDGAPLPYYKHLRHNIRMKGKEIQIIDKASLAKDFKPQGEVQLLANYTASIRVPFGDLNLNEIGGMYPRNDIDYTTGSISYKRGIIFINNYIENSELECVTDTVRLKLDLDFDVRIAKQAGAVEETFITVSVCILPEDGIKPKEILIEERLVNAVKITNSFVNKTYSMPEVECKLEKGERISVLLSMWDRKTDLRDVRYEYRFNSASIQVTSQSLCEDSFVDVTFPHEALSRIVESISNNQITVRSDYYGRQDSNVHPAAVDGEGSMRVITSGFRLRNYIDPEKGEAKFQLSFKELIDMLKPIDNIGYSYMWVDGKLQMRVEPMEWFYKNNVILELTDNTRKLRTVIPEEFWNGFKIGYKKYESNRIGDLDAIMTEREYRTSLQTLGVGLEMMTSLVADSYAIEYTRRRANDKDTKSWTYDNDIFVIQTDWTMSLIRNRRVYFPLTGVQSSSGIISPQSLYNAAISPARCAKKWVPYLTGWRRNGKDEPLIFTSGKGNTKAQTQIEGEPESVAENGTVYGNKPIWKPEILGVNHPLSVEDFDAIRLNPYGLIRVDGEDCYIREIRFSRKQRQARFKLKPKY